MKGLLSCAGQFCRLPLSKPEFCRGTMADIKKSPPPSQSKKKKEPSKKGHKADLTTYASLLGSSLASKVDLLSSILQGAHYPSVGRYKERLRAKSIEEFIPRTFAVANGFVLFPAEYHELEDPPRGFDPRNMSQHVLSRECDILVYDSGSVPVVFRDEDFVVLRPESVKSVIEVKGAITTAQVTRTLNNFLDFGRKWRNCQLFYRSHYQDTCPRPSLHLMAWDVGTDQKGRALMNGTRLRRQIRNFYKKHLKSSELTGMPILEQAFVYNECEVIKMGWFDPDDENSRIKDGWDTRSGQFVRLDDGGKAIRDGDRTIATLLAAIHWNLGKSFNRFFSYMAETKLDHELPYEHDGFECWLEDERDIRAINTEIPEA